jgi:hypothetical protein
MAKVCKDCLALKPLDQFGSVGGKQAHLKRTYCKACSVLRTSQYRNTPKGKQVNSQACNNYYKNNKEVYYRNKPLRAHHQAKRRACKLQATPSWLTDHDWGLIKKTYEAAKLAEEKYKEPYHVDHIVPLQGENICGLHVPWNLQVIKACDNMSKGNKMPEEGLVQWQT